MSDNFIQEFKAQTIFQMHENLPRIKKCLALLSENEIWLQPNDNTNSMANLILHLCGNIRQYIISSLGNKTDTRDRDLEFTATDGYTKKELFVKLVNTVKQASTTIEQASETELIRVRSVQGFNLSGIAIVIHVTEHLSYHTGQIALFTKLVKNKDLGFYADMDLTIKNS